MTQVLAKINIMPVFTFSSGSSIMVSMNLLDSARRAQVLACYAVVRLLPTVPDMCRVVYYLDKSIACLNSPAIDQYSDLEAKRLIHELDQLGKRLAKMLRLCSDVGIDKELPYRALLKRIEEKNEHLGSITEGLRMSLEPSFEDCIAECEKEVRSAIESSARRTLVVKV